MSTDYISEKPLTLRQALRVTGWRIDDYDPQIPDYKPGRGMHWVTDGRNFLLTQSSKGHLFVSRTGANEAEGFVEPLGLISEYEDAHFKIRDRLYKKKTKRSRSTRKRR